MNIIELSIKQLTTLIGEKKISAVEVTQQYIDQIKKVNPKINAIVEFDTEVALAQARELDAKQARNEPLGHCMGFLLQ